jgi:hypothetical protein
LDWLINQGENGMINVDDADNLLLSFRHV